MQKEADPESDGYPDPHTQQTPPTHLFRQWSLKPTGFLWVKLLLGRPHFSLYDVALYYIM